MAPQALNGPVKFTNAQRIKAALKKNLIKKTLTHFRKIEQSNLDFFDTGGRLPGALLRGENSSAACK